MQGMEGIERWSLTQHQDTPYLSNILKEIEAENKERADLESLTVQPKRR